MHAMKRVWNHITTGVRERQRCFPEPVLKAIAQAIAEGEKRHSGELRFVIEARLRLTDLLSRRGPRERALELFSLLRIWDTEQNSGVLIYIVLAEHAVEILADRGINKRVGEARWREICLLMQEHFAKARYREGALAGIQAITAELERHFPPGPEDINEFSNEPVLL